MPIEKGNIVQVRNLKDFNENEEPYITERMMSAIGKVFTVSHTGKYESESGEVEKKYIKLDGSKYYWDEKWLEQKNITYKYKNLMTL